MTSPGGALPSHRLAAVAAWDVPLLRGAVTTLAAVSERLLVWRARVEGVGRALEAAECWSGPAADSAAAALLELSVVATAVEAALAASSSMSARLVGEATEAQRLAAHATALAATFPDGLDAAVSDHQQFAGVLRSLWPGAAEPPADRVVVLAEEALEHAASAAAAAVDALEATARLTVRGATVPVTFGDLLTALPAALPAATPELPRGRDPGEVAAWWAGLSAAAQLAAVCAAPEVIGGLDGIPAWARDRANRLVLARAMEDPRTPLHQRLTARVVAQGVAAEEAAGHTVQLHLFDLDGDRVVLAFGDLDRADDIALLVPGIGNTPGDDLGPLARDALDVDDAAHAAAPGATVATVVWLGYRTPSVGGVLTRGAAGRGGAALARALTGLAASRAVTGSARARTTVLAHSYGTVVVDEAADAPGRLAADAVVLLGSPGMQDDAASLEAPEVFDATGPDDLVSRAGWFGAPTDSSRYGSTALPVGPSTGHSDYYDPGGPTLAAMGEVVSGVRTPD